jgi:hypothetical protein
MIKILRELNVPRAPVNNPRISVPMTGDRNEVMQPVMQPGPSTLRVMQPGPSTLSTQATIHYARFLWPLFQPTEQPLIAGQASPLR